MDLVVTQKVSNNVESESKFERKDQESKHKGRLGEEREMVLNRYKSSEFNLFKETDPPQSESLLFKCLLFYIIFLKKPSRPQPTLRNLKSTCI